MGIPEAHWRRLFEQIERDLPGLDTHWGHRGTLDSDVYPITYLYGPKPMPCGDCGKPLQHPALKLSGGSGEALLGYSCSSCGAKHSVADVGGLVAEILTNARDVHYLERGAVECFLRLEGKTAAQLAREEESRARSKIRRSGLCPICQAPDFDSIRCRACGHKSQTEWRSRRLLMFSLMTLVLTGLGFLVFKLFQPQLEAFRDRRVQSRYARAVISSGPRRVVTVVRTASLQWGGTVAESSHPGVAQGDACSFQLDIRVRGSEFRLIDASVHCGKENLYKKSRQSSVSFSCRISEQQHGLAVYEYGTICGAAVDAGTSRLQIDTGLGEAWVSSSSWRVKFEVDPNSALREGARLFGNKSQFQYLSTSELVVTVSAGSPARVDELCDLALLSETEKAGPCRVRINCGSTTLYGGYSQGYNRCRRTAGSAWAADDTGSLSDDGDPRLEMDLGGGSVVVSDPALGLRVELRVLPARDEGVVP